MRAAIRALLPPFLCGAVFFCLFTANRAPAFLAIFYGLALLATGHFAPGSMVWLGWSFLVVGLAAFFVAAAGHLALSPDFFMLATFGGFHLVYAACTWSRGKAPSTADSGAS
jgi:hypothetical protein